METGITFDGSTQMQAQHPDGNKMGYPVTPRTCPEQKQERLREVKPTDKPAPAEPREERYPRLPRKEGLTSQPHAKPSHKRPKGNGNGEHARFRFPFPLALPAAPKPTAFPFTGNHAFPSKAASPVRRIRKKSVHRTGSMDAGKKAFIL